MKKQKEMAVIEKYTVAEKANTDDVWLAPYVGYVVFGITHPNGQFDFILADELYTDQSDMFDYLDEEE